MKAIALKDVFSTLEKHLKPILYEQIFHGTLAVTKVYPRQKIFCSKRYCMYSNINYNFGQRAETGLTLSSL